MEAVEAVMLLFDHLLLGQVVVGYWYKCLLMAF